MEENEQKSYVERLAEIDAKIEQVNKEIEESVERLGRMEQNNGIDPFDFAVDQGLKYIEFNKEGKIVNFWKVGKARDFRKKE